MTRVSEIATEASGTFSKEFPLAYKYCIVEAEKRKAAPPVAPHERSLMVAASPSQIIKRGELYKLGAINKSWKKRFFTAHNKANNFVIEYADDDIGNKKGHITCFGSVLLFFLVLFVTPSHFNLIDTWWSLSQRKKHKG